jgi:hypothetical protein
MKSHESLTRVTDTLHFLSQLVTDKGILQLTESTQIKLFASGPIFNTTSYENIKKDIGGASKNSVNGIRKQTKQKIQTN